MKPRHLLTAIVCTAGILCLGWQTAALAQDKADVVGAEVARPPVVLDGGVAAAMVEAPTSQPVEAASPKAANLLRETINVREVAWERAKAAVKDNEDKARQAVLKQLKELSLDDFAEARRRIAQGEHALTSNQNVAVPEEYKALGKSLADLKAYLDNLEEKWNAYKVQEAVDKARVEQAEALRRVVAQRRERVNELMNQVMAARQERDYKTAIDLLDQVLKLDSNNKQAQWMRADAENLSVVFAQQHIDTDRDIQLHKALLNVREAGTPYDDPIHYPDADIWRTLTERRKAYSANMPTESPANQRVRELMQKNVPEIRFQAITFENALTFLRDLQRVNINPNWGAMEALGITKATEVTLQLRDVTFETALKELLAKVAGREDVLDYMIRDGVIKISTKEDLDKIMYIMVYDVRDLIHPLTDFRVPLLKVQNNQQIGGGGGIGGGGVGGGAGIGGGGGGGGGRLAGGGLFGGDDNAGGNAGKGGEEAAAQTRQEKLTKFLDLIKTTVLPESWAPTGAGDAKENDDGLLVVKQTANGHRELQKMLVQLREHSRIEIAIEVRFLDIESDFLEDIGLDLDFVFNNDQSHHWSTIPMNISTFAHQAVGSTTADTSGFTGIFDPIPSAFTVAGSFMDDVSVDFFLRATQAHRQRNKLDSARITLMNGHEGYVRSGVSTDYVTILDPANQVFGIAQFSEGVAFGLRATCTADRRYVIMTVFPNRFKDSIAGTRTFTIVRDTSNSNTVGGGTLVVYSVDIDLIRSEGEEVRSTVMVPDQGTLLLGGERISDELQVETGVPILSKIPIIKRGFTYRSFVKRERTVMLLIRPQILIPDELEP